MALPFPLVRLQLVNKSFTQQGVKEKILNNISLTIEPKTIVGIIGRSGAGKSTLLRCLNGLEKPDEGHIFFGTDDLCLLDEESLRNQRKKIGVVFQNYNLLQSKSVFDNIALPLKLAGFSTDIQQERVAYLASLVGLDHKLSSYPHQLSGGQCQRVAIARALAIETKLLLCDEFTSALDSQTTLEILDLLKRLRHDLGLTVVMVTHDMNVMQQIADYVYVLDHGSVVEHGPTLQILTGAHHPVTQSLLREFLKDELPDFIANKLHPAPQGDDDIMLKLTFKNQYATKPLIAQLVQQWHLPLNIIAGNLHHSGTHTFGHLMVCLKYDPNIIAAISTFLQNSAVQVEIMGYLQWQS